MKHSIHDKHPFFHRESVEFLSSIIKPDWLVLETGCGSSTIWFSSKAKSVVSFEHSEIWYDRVKELIEVKGIKNIDLRLLPDYPKKGVWGFKVNEFDLVSIDGSRKSRVISVKTSIPFLKPGGYLLLDDTDYNFYDEAKDLLKVKGWEGHVFGGTKRHATTIWRKP